MLDEGLSRSQDQGTGRSIAGVTGSSPSSTLTQPLAKVVYPPLIALVVVLSIVWRAINLNAFSLSNDEGAYLMWAWLVHTGHPLYSETVSVSAPFLIVALDWAFELAGVSLVTGRALVLAFLGVGLISIAWAGRLMHSWLAGLMAAVAFSLAPLAFLLSRMAIGEIPSLAMACLSMALAVTYWRRGGKGWLVLSGLTLSVSVLLKAMNPLVAVPILWLIATRHWHNQKRWSRIATSVVVWGLAGLLPVVACLLIYDPAALYDQVIAFRFELRDAFPWLPGDNLARLGLFLSQHWGIAGLAVAGGMLLGHRAKWEILIALGLWLTVSALSLLLHSPLFSHHSVILLPPLALLAGIGFAETVALLRERQWAWGTLGLAGVLAFVLAVPGAIEDNQIARAASFGREAEAIAFLEQVTHPTDNVISDNLLLPFMAGRQTPPPMGDVAQVAINSGRQTSERLIAISEAYPVEAVANWALRLPYLDTYLDWVESNYLVRRVWDNHHIIYAGRRVSKDEVPNRIEAGVGDSIQLLGYETIDGGDYQYSGRLAPTEVKSRTLDVIVYWQARTPLGENYHVFVQLLDPLGRLVTQHDGPPMHGHLPTADWSPADVIPDRHTLLLPDNLPRGTYQLIAGMYLPKTLERLPVHATHPQGDDDYVTLTRLDLGN